MRTTKHILILLVLLILTTVLLNSAHAKLYPTVDDPYVSGLFGVMYHVDPMSDEIISTLIISREFLGKVVGRASSFAVALFPDGQVRVLYNFDKYLVGDSDREVLVRYRVGKNPASGHQYWKLVVPDREMAWVNMGLEEVAEFFTSMIGSDEIIFEVTDPYDREIIRDTFSLRGFTAALTKAVTLLDALRGERS